MVPGTTWGLRVAPESWEGESRKITELKQNTTPEELLGRVSVFWSYQHPRASSDTDMRVKKSQRAANPVSLLLLCSSYASCRVEVTR